MMRVLLICASLLLVASVATAYVQPGHINQSSTSDQVSDGGSDDATVLQGSVTPDPISGSGTVDRRRRGTDPGRPANPVPEPGTMVLASLGLIALGAAVRRQRH